MTKVTSSLRIHDVTQACRHALTPSHGLVKITSISSTAGDLPIIKATSINPNGEEVSLSGPFSQFTPDLDLPAKLETIAHTSSALTAMLAGIARFRIGMASGLIDEAMLQSLRKLAEDKFGAHITDLAFSMIAGITRNLEYNRATSAYTPIEGEKKEDEDSSTIGIFYVDETGIHPVSLKDFLKG